MINNKKEIIFIRDSKMSIEKPYSQFKDREIVVEADAANTKPCKAYKKKISNIVSEAKSNN